MGEQDNPVVANKVMELDGSLCRVGLKVRRSAPQSQLLLFYSVDGRTHFLFLCGWRRNLGHSFIYVRPTQIIERAERGLLEIGYKDNN